MSLSLLAAADHGMVHGDFLPWLVLFLPLAVAVLVAIFPALRRSGRASGLLATGAVMAGFAITLVKYFLPSLSGGFTPSEGLVSWVEVGKVVIPFGTRMDQLALLMTLIVTGVGSAIFVYALGYMHGDPSMGRFFGKFSLFVFSMLGIVLSPNFFQTFIFWELVGASSYLLIGYYWTKHSAGEAAKKAFLTNRVGDFGFLLGILMVWVAVLGVASPDDLKAYGAFDFTVIAKAVAAVPPETLFGGAGAMALAAALVFMGAMGKSAQFPLHVWLPDAMEGPTPVSALMHAATMVAAGIYMVIRSYHVFEGASWAPTLIAWLGAITAFIAATMAITQRDIKKVLAYSTLSQLGYMTMALGCGAYTAAMFHLTTHAFFKALLFLCAGSVIHGCHHEQDMFQMGGIRRLMPTTWRTWALGTLALCGIVPFAGFWSKDEILGAVSHAHGVGGHTLLWVVGTVVAGLTAFYMGRATILTFFGSYRGHAHPHESPRLMTWPLIALALVSLGIGAIGLPAFGPAFGGTLPADYHGNWIERLLHAWHVGGPAELHLSVALISLGVAGLGLWLAWRVYGPATKQDAHALADPLPARLGGLWTTWDNLWYVDRFYRWLVGTVQQGFARLCWLFERWVVIQVLYNGTARIGRLVGERLRRIQDGRLTGYVTSFVLGAVILTAAVLYAVLA
jgi:NADH-quinone oxidoreductase subunit L